MDFGNPKKLRFLTVSVLFRVLKRLEEEEGGGGGAGISLQTLWHALWGQSTFLKNQTEDAHLHNWWARNMIPLLFQSVLLSNKCQNNV